MSICWFVVALGSTTGPGPGQRRKLQARFGPRGSYWPPGSIWSATGLIRAWVRNDSSSRLGLVRYWAGASSRLDLVLYWAGAGYDIIGVAYITCAPGICIGICICIDIVGCMGICIGMADMGCIGMDIMGCGM